MNEQSENLPSSPAKVEPICGVVANIVEGRPYGTGGQEIRRGTPKFRAKQKVYLWDVYWGMGGIVSTVIGHFHGKHEYVTCSIETAYLMNFRPTLIYSPTIIERIRYGYQRKAERVEPSAEYIAQSPIPLDGSEQSMEKANRLAERLSLIANERR